MQRDADVSINSSDISNEPENADTKHPFVRLISKDNLNLSHQGLTDKDIPEIMQFLLQYPTIKTLDLSLNNIGDQGIADFAERNMTVVEVNFTGNNIGDIGLVFFAYKNQTVTYADFSLNLITNQGIAKFAELNQACHRSLFSSVQFH